MAQTVDDLIHSLVSTVQDLPPDRAAEVLDFASYLHSRYARISQERGSAQAILQALDEAGPLDFVPGELAMLLADINHSRDSDLGDRG